jgi:MFS family permease
LFANFLNKPPSILKASFIVGISSLFYLYEFFLRVSPGSITHELMRDLHTEAGAIGAMSGLFFFGYAPMQIPVGLLCDHFSPKKLLILAVSVCGVATLAFAFTNSIFVAGITRFFIGIVSAFAFVGPLVIATKWFEEKHIGTVAGAIQLVGCLGAIFAGGPITSLIAKFGWRNTMFYAALFGFILSILFKLFLKDSPSDDTEIVKNKLSILSEFKILCKDNKTWWLSIVAFSCWAPISIFAELWGTSFLTSVYHVSTFKAAQSTAWVWVGIGLGSIIASIWSTKINSRKKPIYILNIIGFISSIAVIFYHFNTLATLDIFLFFLGFAAGVQPITFAIACEQNPKKQQGAAMGFNNMAVIFGGVLFQPLIGYLLTALWDHKIYDGAPVYSFSAYKMAFLVIPLCYILSTVVTYFKIKETNCKSIYL